jgi:GT2 family glycosyltransferase
MKISMLTARSCTKPYSFELDENNWQTWRWAFSVWMGLESVERKFVYTAGGYSSIFWAYNLLAEKASGSILCFIHDDARILSKLWLRHLSQFFAERPEGGVVGLVGSDKMVPNELYPLLYANGEDHYFGKLVQGNVTQQFHPVDKFKEVVAVDGFCFFIRKEVLEKIGGFDEKTYDRDGPCFHMYDIDLCFEARKAGYKNYVIDGILAQHLSIGKLDDGWHKARKIFIEKWGEKEIIIG